MPNLIRPGVPLNIFVEIVNSIRAVTVDASLVNVGDSTSIITSSINLQNSSSGEIMLKIPEGLPHGTYDVTIAGHGGLHFSKKTFIKYQHDNVIIAIQTDKGMYSENQKIQLRVVTFHPDLKPYRGHMDIKLIDGTDTLLQQWIGIRGGLGVVEKVHRIGTPNSYGDWKIHVTAQGTVKEKEIQVHRYVLPKFNVTITNPSNYKLGSGYLPVTVRAEYTYDKPVTGIMTLQLQHPSHYITWNITRPINGSLSFNIPSSAFENVESMLLVGQVGETTTGTTVTATSYIKINEAEAEPSLTFGPSTDVFRPGLPYVTYMRLQNVANISGKVVMMQGTVTDGIIKICRFGNYKYRELTTKDLPKQQIQLSQEGYARIELNPGPHTYRYNLWVHYSKGVSNIHHLSSEYSPTNKYIKLIPTTPYGQTNKDMRIKVISTEHLNRKIFCQVIALGMMVYSNNFDGHGLKEIMHNVFVMPTFYPRATILIYYIADNGEVLNDQMNIEVRGKPFQTNVSVNFSKSVAKPGEKITLSVTSRPNSTVYLLSVDKSVLILRDGFDIAPSEVFSDVQRYDVDLQGNGRINRRMFTRGHEAFADDTMMKIQMKRGSFDVFQNAGVNILTDMEIHMGFNFLTSYCSDNINPTAHAIRDLTGRPILPPTLGNIPDSIRDKFPETWIWEAIDIGHTGRTTIDVTVPDTITTWITTAFSVNEVYGFGMTSTSEKLQVFKDFFLEISLPPTVKIGEIPVVKVAIHNYKQSREEIIVRIVHTDNTTDKSGYLLQVPAQGSLTRSSPIYLNATGNSNITVMAVKDDFFSFTHQLLDQVTKTFNIKAKGVQQENSTTTTINLDGNTNSFDKTITLPLPPEYVPNTKQIALSLTGDVIAPSVAGMDSLIRLPTGCGEQTMSKMAPNVFILKYLDKTNQLTSDIKNKAIEYLRSGRRRELSYQRNDGSFSAWGNRDRSGSMWLTAFVALSFHQAKDYIYVDDKVLIDAINWIKKYQNSDGSFREPGRIIHTNMQGGSVSSKGGLTAFVLLALMENGNLGGKVDTANAVRLAKTYLERNSNSISQKYALALSSFALKLSGSSTAQSVFRKLQATAIIEDLMKYWKDTQRRKRVAHWTSQKKRASPIDIETSAYALLYHTHNNEADEGMAVLRWLTSQRNPSGGFASTQDTVVSLRAMTEFATLISGSRNNNENIQLDVVTAGFQKTLFVNNVNKHLLQKIELPAAADSVQIQARGTGMAIVDVSMTYNVASVTGNPAYHITTTIVKESFDSIIVKVCSRRLLPGPSGMVIKEIEIPSGFAADLSFDNSGGSLMKHKETKLDKMIMYFEEIGTSDVCVSVKADRVDKVSQSQTYSVVVYDYYEPDNSGFGHYTSGLLKNLHICQVCKLCEICRQPTSTLNILF